MDAISSSLSGAAVPLAGLQQLLFNFGAVKNQVSGPVAIVAAGAEVARVDFAGLYQFAAIVSINLAVVNALPLPALDGGYMLLLVRFKHDKTPNLDRNTELSWETIFKCSVMWSCTFEELRLGLQLAKTIGCVTFLAIASHGNPAVFSGGCTHRCRMRTCP